MSAAIPPARPAAAENPASRPGHPQRALFAPLRRFWAGEFDLGRVGMAVTIPVLAWVFYTTSSGMIDIMQKEQGDLVGLAGTLVATTAVLIMLASTSWSLGADLAALIARRHMARERMVVKTLVTAAVFAFVFSISAFFSFTYYYNNIFKLSSRKIVAELQPMELAADIVLPAAKQIEAANEAAATKIVATPSVKAYLASLDTLIETGRTAGPALREAIRKNQEAQQATLARAAQQTALELESARAAARQYDEAQADIAALERSVAALDAVIGAKQEEIAALGVAARQEEQLAVDAEHGLDNKGAVCGPNCRTHRAKAEEANRRAATIRQTLAGPTAERASALRKRDALSAQAIAYKQRADLAASAAKRQIPKGEAAVDLDATLNALAALRDAFRSSPVSPGRSRRSRSANPFSSPRDSRTPCRPPAPATSRASRRAKRESCWRGATTLSPRARASTKNAASRAGLRDSIAAIVAKIRAAPASDRAAAATGFNEAKALVDACVVSGKTVGLTEEDVRELLKKSDAYMRAHSTERNKFELAREAFWSFTPDSTMAIGVAVAQDAFLFIMKFLSEIFKRGQEARERRQFSAPMDLSDDEEEPVEMRAMKAMLRVARPIHGDMSEIDPQAAALQTLASAVRENLFAMLNRLVRDEIAHVDRKGGYVVDNVTIAQVESRLFAAMRPRAQRAARFALEGSAAGAGPAAYYSDALLARTRRRRASALERYLSVEAASAESGVGGAGD